MLHVFATCNKEPSELGVRPFLHAVAIHVHVSKNVDIFFPQQFTVARLNKPLVVFWSFM